MDRSVNRARTQPFGEDPPTYYHGGAPGRQRGAYILPPSITGAACTADHVAKTDGVARRDRVYVTTSFNAALLYAGGHRRGVIYEVEPDGELEPDPDCNEPGLSYQCARARIRKVLKVKPADLDAARRVILHG